MRRKYTLEFKKEAAELVTQQGYSRNKAALVLGVDPKNIRRWVNELKGTEKNKPSTEAITPVEEENRRLRKENERLRMEREILKKAAAFFANEKP